MAPQNPTPSDDLSPDSGISAQYEASLHEDSPESSEESPPSHSLPGRPTSKSQPQQKRRRVTRACDECRRKKIKCDGKQPCTHCTVYSYECTYDQPSNRRRNATPQYIEALESQLKRAKALLHAVLPAVDLSDSSVDAHLHSGLLSPGSHASHAAIPPHLMHFSTAPGASTAEEISESHLEAMVRATGQLELDEEGKWDYHGYSSGLNFMKGLQQFGDMFQLPPDSSPSVRARKMSQDPPSPSSINSSNMPRIKAELPDKEIARKLCDNAIIDAGAMIRIVHLPSFYQQLDLLYCTTPEEYGDVENRFLPLLYSVLALGKLFSREPQELHKSHYDAHVEEGFIYFRAARQLLDLTECRDLTSLQALVFLIQFLQSAARLSACYTYIGVALRSAVRMGLHRSFTQNFTPIEAETRKRVFWAIRRMDIYVGAMLGLPRALDDEEIDQEWPAEVDDELITETQILPMPDGSISIMAAFNAHTGIVQVLSKICKHVYPVKGTQPSGQGSVTYKISYSKIRELEQDLALWLDRLPMELKPGGDAPLLIQRVQQLLRMAFGHAQLLLYRPFLHYVSHPSKDTVVDQRAFACASACVSVSRNIIHIATEMQRKKLLGGAYWFSMYTTFFAVVSILYFVLENPTKATSFELLRDAVEGKDVLALFAKRSMAAERCSVALQGMFERLPESIRHGGEIIESRKRRQDSSPLPTSRTTFLKQDDWTAPRRASTVPDSNMTDKHAILPQSLPFSQSHFASLGMDRGYNSPSPSNPDHFDAVPGLTPTSSTASLAGFGIAPTHTPQARPTLLETPLLKNFADQSQLNMPLSDISTMMFPSPDPLAYPNQPMTTFENRHPHVFDRNSSSPAMSMPYQLPGTDVKSHSSLFAHHGLPVSVLDRSQDRSAHLLDPMSTHMMPGMQAPRGYPALSGAPAMAIPSVTDVQYEDLLGHEDWTQAFLDAGADLNNPRASMGVGAQFGPGVADWR